MSRKNCSRLLRTFLSFLSICLSVLLPTGDEIKLIYEKVDMIDAYNTVAADGGHRGDAARPLS